MPCYQVIVINNFEAEDCDAQYAFDLLTMANPIFATLEGAQRFCQTDAEEWLKSWEDDENPIPEEPTVDWNLDKPGTWVGELPGIERMAWSAIIEECRFLDTEGVA